MKLQPQELLLIKIRSFGILYSLLRKPKKWEDKGDIDIIVNDFRDIHKLLIKLNFIKFKFNKFKRKYIKFDKTNNYWLHIDVQTRIEFGELILSKKFTNYLLVNSKLVKDKIVCLNELDENILNLFHYGINKKVINTDKFRKIKKIKIQELKEKNKNYYFLKEPIEKYIEIIDKLLKNKVNSKEIIFELRKKYSVNKKINLFARIFQRIKNILKDQNSFAFLGPDGSGKTTLTKKLDGLRWVKLRNLYMGNLNPSLANSYLQKFLVKILIKKNNYPKQNLIGFLIRILWHIISYVDFQIRIYSNKWFSAGGGILIFDRYACDMYIRNQTWFNYILYVKLFVKPKFVFLCIGDSNIINMRKPELSPHQIKNTIKIYRSILKRKKIPFKEVNTTKNNYDVNLKIITQKIVKFE